MSHHVPLLRFGQAIAHEIGETFFPLPHVQRICTELELVFAGKTQYLMILIPPRHGKTLPTSQLFPAWAYGMSPGSKFIMASYAATLADKNSDMVRTIMSTDAYRKIFPGVNIGSKSVKGDWNTNHQGWMTSVGRDGSITGYGAGGLNPYFEGAIILDDLIKAGEARSPVVREQAKNFIVGTIENRRNSHDTPIILIMQRLHPDDPAGWILKNNFMGPWKVVQLKAIDENGKALWPQRKSVEQWMNLKEIDPFTYHAQGQQEPIMPGGNMIKAEWWKRWTPRDVKQCIGSFISMDTSYGKVKTVDGDYSVMQLWLYCDEFMLLYDQWRGKWDFPTLRQMTIDFYRKYEELPVNAVFVEDKASGTSLVQDLETQGIPIYPWMPEEGKVTRLRDPVAMARDCLTDIFHGRVMIPDDNYALWVPGFKEEASEFTEDMSHTHDDQVDGMTMANKIWREQAGGLYVKAA